MLNDSVNAFAEVDESDYDSEEESKGENTQKLNRRSLGKVNRKSIIKNRESTTSET